MIFSELESLASLATRVGTWLRRRRTPLKPESVATRLIQLFEAHGVHRNQVPRVLGHSLMLKHVRDDKSLLDVVTDEMLESAARLFAVNRDWLEGATEQIYPMHDFYKKPERFVEFLDTLLADGVLLVAEQKSTNSTHCLSAKNRLASSEVSLSTGTTYATTGSLNTGNPEPISPHALRPPGLEVYTCSDAELRSTSSQRTQRALASWTLRTAALYRREESTGSQRTWRSSPTVFSPVLMKDTLVKFPGSSFGSTLIPRVS